MEGRRKSRVHPPIPIEVDVGPIVGEHRVVLGSLAWLPDVLRGGQESYLDMTYRFDPPLTEEERVSPVFEWKVWELALQDELGNVYDGNTGGLGINGGDREIHPAPPEQAKTLTLSVGTPAVTPRGELCASRLVRRITVDLTGEKGPIDEEVGC